MKVTRFDPTASLIIVRGFVWGPRQRSLEMRLAVDTAAAETHVKPEILDSLGYSA